MLVVTVELWKHGSELHKKHLGTAKIANDGSGGGADSKLGHYDVTLSKWGKPSVKWRGGHVSNFKRLKYGPWDLLYLSLRAALGRKRVSELEQDW